MPVSIQKATKSHNEAAGILLVDKPVGCTSFKLVALLRRILGVKKIGHAGTLDPFATGVMVMLIGRSYTRLSDELLTNDKEYVTTVRLGIETDSYDCDGNIIAVSDIVPTEEAVVEALKHFQGEVMQVPPMFSAKKLEGKKLYELARKGISVERQPVKVTMSVTLLSYNYPNITLNVACSKGTYIRSIAHDLGRLLSTGAHLTQLRRTRSGNFHIDQCLNGAVLFDTACNPDNVIKAMRDNAP